MSCMNKPNFCTATTLPLSIGSNSLTTKCSTKSTSFLSDIIAAVTLEETNLCGSCEEGITATSKCKDCSEMLCDPCVRAHQRVRITKDHRIEHLHDVNISLNGAGSLGSSSRASSSPCNFCDIHREPHRLYCETCATPACTECNMTDRCGHQLIYIQDAMENARMSSPRLTNEVRTAVAMVREALETVGCNSLSVDDKAHETSNEIKAVFKRCMVSLEERQQELLMHVEQIRLHKKKMLLLEAEKLRSVFSRLLNTSDHLHESMESSNHLDLILANEKATSELKQFKMLYKQLFICEDHTINFIPPDTNFLRVLSTIGTVNTTNRTSVICKPGNVDITPAYTISPIGEPVMRLNTKRNSAIYGAQAPVVLKRNTTAALAFGTEGEVDGQLCRPWGVCCNKLGQIIIADRSNNRIQVFNPNGTFRHKFGTHGTAPGQFDRPAGVAVNPNGDIVVADKDNHRVQVFKIDGTFLLSFGEKGSRNGQFNYPWDVACNAQGQIIVSDTRNHRIQLFSAEGLYINKYGFEGASSMWKHFDSPRGVCFTPTGSIIVTDFNNHRLVIIDQHFMQAQFLGQEGSNYKQFLRPQGICCDDDGNVIVADSRNNRIQVFESNGNFLWKVGQAGKDLGDLDRPSGICLNPEGRIVVVDFGNNRVQIF